MKTNSLIFDFFESNVGVRQGRTHFNVSMTSYTTFRCHGVSEVVYLPRNREDLSHMMKNLSEKGFVFRKDWNIIGRGSNVLIPDEGYPGCLIDLSGDFTKIEVLEKAFESVLVKVEAGVPNGTLLQYLKNQGWGGFEFSFGIPGSIGGGIRMNAGTPQGWFSDVLEKVELMDLRGKIQNTEVLPQMFEYRDFPSAHDQVILSGTFVFHKESPMVIKEKIETVKNQRKNQPLEFPNIGSVFKNPEGNYAGKLIQDAGLKGLRIGDAQISEKHGNFIVNLGNAKTKDVVSLIKRVQKDVQDKFGVMLEPEVHCLGDCGL